MAELLTFKPRRAEEPAQFQKRGPARCIRCQHCWEAVVHETELRQRDGWFDCPECKDVGVARFTGRHAYDGAVWKCRCGNDWFHVIPEGWFCPGCGLKHPAATPHRGA